MALFERLAERWRVIAPNSTLLMLWLVGAGVIWTKAPTPNVWIWTLASEAVGGLLGFIFGIPKTRLSKSSGVNSSARVTPNTNLESFSDALMKLLIGAGLTQIGHLGEGLNTLSRQLSDPTQREQTFFLGLLVYFSIHGFLAAYLVTRLYITRDFHAAVDALGATRHSASGGAGAVLQEQKQGG